MRAEMSKHTDRAWVMSLGVFLVALLIRAVYLPGGTLTLD